MKKFLISKLNVALSFFWLVAITFSIVGILFAATPNPGHDFSAIGGGTVQGDLLYGSAADTISALPKNTSATRYLSNTGASNNPAWAQVDVTNGVTGILPTANGGTGIAFFSVSGPASTAKTFTFPNANATVLTSNAAVTVGQGGTGLTTTADDSVFVGDSTSAVTARALPSCSGATTDKLLYNISTNTFSCGTDQTGGGSSGQPYYPTRQWCTLRPLGSTATVLTSVGCAAFVVTGTAAASSQTDSYYVQHTSATTINTLAGVTQTFIQTQGRHRPKLTAKIRTDSTIDNRRIWVALTPVALTTTDGVGAVTTRYVGVRYSTSAGDTQWQCASSDGTTGSVLSTGVTVTANTAYTITVDWSVDGTLTCTVNGTSVNKTSNLDATQTAQLGFHSALTTLTAAARVHRTAFIHLETN